VPRAYTVTLTESGLWVTAATIDARDGYLLLGVNGGSKPYLVRIYKDGVVRFESALDLAGAKFTGVVTYGDVFGVALDLGYDSYFVSGFFVGFVDGIDDVAPFSIEFDYQYQVSYAAATQRTFALTNYFQAGDESSYSGFFSCGHYASSSKAVVR